MFKQTSLVLKAVIVKLCIVDLLSFRSIHEQEKCGKVSVQHAGV